MLNPVSNCLLLYAVPQILPGTSDFTQSIIPYNLRLPFTPAALAIPTTIEQVQVAVSCGVSNNAKVSARSGGHSYASGGLGGEDGHLVIDMKGFRDVVLDKETGIVTIGTGAKLGNVAFALFEQDRRAISHGSCPAVGMGGHAIHGGFGLASRTYGLTLDNMVEATVVLANSSAVIASVEHNPDLFWAIRGAGSSFGIVTSMKFQTFPAPLLNVIFSYNYYYSWNQKQAQVIKTFVLLQDYAKTSIPAEMNLRLTLAPSWMTISGAYYGPLEKFQPEIESLLVDLGSLGWSSVKELGWVDGLLENSHGPLITPNDQRSHDTFFVKSLFTMPEGLSLQAIEAFTAYIFNTAVHIPRTWWVTISIVGGSNSAIAKVTIDNTSYAHRNSLLMFQFYDQVASGAYPPDGFSFLNNFLHSITSAMPDKLLGMYLNYPDPTLTAEQAHTAYFGDHYARLVAIKKAIDPLDVFSSPQAVSSS